MSVFKKEQDLNRHQKSKKKIICNCCQKTFCNSDHHQRHLRTVWNSENKSKDLKQQVNPASGYESYEGFKKLLEEKDYDIGTKTTTDEFKTVYDFKIDSTYTYDNLRDFLQEMYRNQ